MRFFHRKVSAKADGGDASLVRPSDWNDYHQTPYPIDVKDYGAVGNGATDDTAAIQAAIDAATVPGQKVVFPYTASGYKITAVLNVTARPLVLEGDSGLMGGTLITQATANTGAINVGASADGTIIRGLYVKGTGAQTTSRGIYAAKAITLEDCRAEAFFDGVYLDTTSFYSTISRGLYYLNLNAGINVVNCYNTTLLGVRSNGNVYGVYAGNFNGLRLIGCAIEQNTSQACHLDGTSAALLISGCYFESAVGTVDLYLGPSGVVSGVTIQGNLFAVNAVANYWHIDAYSVDHMTVTGNDIRGTGAGGGSVRTTANTTNPVLLNNKAAGTITMLAANTADQLQLGNANLYNPSTDVLKSDDTLWVVGGVRTFVKAGAPVDGDFPAGFVGNGILVVDTTNNKIWSRVGGVWKGAVIA